MAASLDIHLTVNYSIYFGFNKWTECNSTKNMIKSNSYQCYSKPWKDYVEGKLELIHSRLN